MRKHDLSHLFRIARAGFWPRLRWAVRFVFRGRVFK
jgi:hypothetical protein